MTTQKLTYDIVFRAENYQEQKGLNATLDYCKHYIARHNYSSGSYFRNYSGGKVEIVCKETSEVVQSERIL